MEKPTKKAHLARSRSFSSFTAVSLGAAAGAFASSRGQRRSESFSSCSACERDKMTDLHTFTHTCIHTYRYMLYIYFIYIYILYYITI